MAQTEVFLVYGMCNRLHRKDQGKGQTKAKARAKAGTRMKARPFATIGTGVPHANKHPAQWPMSASCAKAIT